MLDVLTDEHPLWECSCVWILTFIFLTYLHCNFQLLYLNLHFIITFNFNHFVHYPTFHLQGMQLTTNSSTPWLPGWHKDGIVEFASSRAFNWYAGLCIMLFDQGFVTYMKLRYWLIDSQYTTSSRLLGSPLQCFFDSKKPLKQF